ncbi:MAG: class I SAM-dependent methyltransferase [Candidatus Velthaea sp.]
MSERPGLLANASPSMLRMAAVSTYVVPDIGWMLRRATRDMGSVLDVGCGAETSLFRFIKKPPQQRRVGLDHFAPSVERSRAARIHDEYMVADVFDARQVGDKSFDCVTLIDVVEHFEKSDGYRLLLRLEHIARRRLVVVTPNGFLPQEPYDGNESQRHLSGWSAGELRTLGYRVYGGNGAKKLRGEYALPTIRPAVLGTVASMLTQFLTVRTPARAFHLFAVKDLPKAG